MDDCCSEKEALECVDEHLSPLPPPHDDHLCHNLLQAVLLRGRPYREADQHVGHDDHLHQCHGETPFDLLPQDD